MMASGLVASCFGAGVCTQCASASWTLHLCFRYIDLSAAVLIAEMSKDPSHFYLLLCFLVAVMEVDADTLQHLVMQALSLCILIADGGFVHH